MTLPNYILGSCRMEKQNTDTSKAARMMMMMMMMIIIIIIIIIRQYMRTAGEGTRI